MFFRNVKGGDYLSGTISIIASCFFSRFGLRLATCLLNILNMLQKLVWFEAMQRLLLGSIPPPLPSYLPPPRLSQHSEFLALLFIVPKQLCFSHSPMLQFETHVGEQRKRSLCRRGGGTTPLTKLPSHPVCMWLNTQKAFAGTRFNTSTLTGPNTL